MDEFLALLESLRNPGEDGPSDSIYDDLSSTYTNDLSTRDAKVEQLTGRIAELESELSRVKIHNYDLLTAMPAESEESDGEDSGESETETDSDNISDDDLFGKD